LLTQNDLKKIKKRLKQKRKNKQRKILHNNVDRYIIQSLFFNQKDPSELTTTNIRRQMINRMVQEGYVPETFFKNVEKREMMSSTIFPSKIAIPHSMEHDALQSGISLMTLQSPVQWKQYSIYVIALVAINKEDDSVFNLFFEKFIEVVSDPINVKELVMSDDYEELNLKLKMMIDGIT